MELYLNVGGKQNTHMILFSSDDIVNWTEYYHGHRDICTCYFLEDKIYNLIHDKGEIPHSHGNIDYILSEKDETKNKYLKSIAPVSFNFYLKTGCEDEAKKLFIKLLMFKK